MWWKYLLVGAICSISALGATFFCTWALTKIDKAEKWWSQPLLFIMVSVASLETGRLLGNLGWIISDSEEGANVGFWTVMVLVLVSLVYKHGQKQKDAS